MEPQGKAAAAPAVSEATPQDGWPIPWQAVEGDRSGALAWIESALAQGTVRALARLPSALQSPLVGALARLARRVDRRHSQAAREFLAVALGSVRTEREREALVLESWRHFLTLVLRSARFDAMVPPGELLAHYELELCPAARSVIDSRRPFLIVGPHLGDFEAAAAVMPALGVRHFYVVSRPPRNRPLSISAQRMRERRGMRLIHRRGAMADVPRIVAAGGTVALLLDQRPRGKSVVAPFFGRPAYCERAAGVLLRRLRVPVIVGCCYTTPTPYRYRLALPCVLAPEELAHASPEAIATRINLEMERMILAQPEQYFWLHDRFAKTPPAD
jgi:Kdo2-lipid IVA lauroyltransferase/acyltransferase